MRLTVQRLYASAARAQFRYQHAITLRNSCPQAVPLLIHRCLSTSSARTLAVQAVEDVHGRYGIPTIPTNEDTSAASFRPSTKSPNRPLPVTCPGCGALSQETTPDEAGYYSRSRKAVRSFFKQQQKKADGEEIHNSSASPDSILNVDSTITHDSVVEQVSPVEHSETPICDRCHDLVYNAKGQSIAHPSVEDIADSIAESPFNRNHVYHVLDAADFPMSLIPGIFKKLELAKPRSQNRRSRHKFPNKPTISFIITRSDLLGPTKEMVDRMMPYFQGVLRTALGRVGREMRLGNVHLVSAKRGWWTRDIKESIWERGGGNWMVGRVNVGKSNLFEVLFPKGSGERAPVYTELETQNDTEDARPDTDFLSEDSLLPPAQPEVPFPAMPIVSNLPGTTASPIRLPFGNQRGELIDLPGIERGNLEDHVQPEHKLDLVMQHRPKVEQHIIKPGQSLLLGGGLIRITPQLDPNDRSTTMLAYPFVPVEAHVTATEKAVGTQIQERTSGIESIVAEGSGSRMASAGVLDLATDVTKIRAGPLLRAGVSVDKLPFRIYSSDILIEGVGWIELVCQVRRKWKSASSELTENTLQGSPEESAKDSITLQGEPTFKPFFAQPNTITEVPPSKETPTFEEFPIPKVEVFSPDGKHISQRRPLGTWIMWDEGTKRRARETASGRPKRSMKGVKKQEKKEKRERESISAQILC